jgi:hypothetical protein
MRIALAFRGMSYMKDYIYNLGDGRSTDPYTVDFSDCIPVYFKNVIKPLKDSGHQVDIFFRTYDSVKLQSFIDQLNPIKIVLSEYDPLAMPNSMFGYRIDRDSAKDIKEYQDENGFIYDSVIETRFDLYIYENITNLYLPDNTVSVITPGQDALMFYPGIFLPNIINVFNTLANNNVLVLNFCNYLDVASHTCYNNKFINNNYYPFYNNSRQLFTPIGHYFKIGGTLEEINDLSSKYYSDVNKCNQTFTSAIN